MALGAAAVLDVWLLASFGWSELLDRNLRIMLWAALVVGWVAAAGWSASQCRRQRAAGNTDTQGDAFTEAVDHYLKGDYYQAEHVLQRLLRGNVRDAEARLMLATLLRRRGRLDEAAGQLDALARFENAGRWQWEMQRERDLMVEAKTQEASAA